MFRTLVVTILSQSCTDVAALKAYRKLDEVVGVTLHDLAAAQRSTIAAAIRVAGLYRQKAIALKQLAQIVSQNYHGNIFCILDQPVEQAREELQKLPKVGPKTADVILSIWGKTTISVDTHVDRVSKRLGLTPPDSNYEQVRSTLMKLYNTREYKLIPLHWMTHGRKYCKARGPLCSTCPIEDLCTYEAKIR
jgi:endonuclease-3